MRLIYFTTPLIAALALAGVIAWLAIYPQPAAAQAGCARMAQIAAGLANGYGEAPVARGSSQSGATIVLFAAPGGATWTIVVVAPDGTACGAASGRDWQALAAIPQGEPS